ncbi:uncharacterized protein B0P05DRAFT_525448 [Gilbertella persicaria]|uniref:uncharacterized protein n=1 Tax=Gilbertella persicaria TaxID=101096 RepID=UPI002220B074|nr:uncharacterized protein B0P05DRAFT_525448 [Gilbertella persicaria]KAI8092249.1 hypothetical protein B0P05DRAFT_525448 [Gilbertella persicaria]
MSSSETNMNRTAMIFGATGAVGKQLLKDVLVNGKYTKVISVGRRSVELEPTIPQDKLEQKTVDFENLEADRSIFKGVSDVYCCFGTTRADAGSAENFIKIDQTYVLNSAKIIAEENKPSDSKLAPVHFLYCSSAGSNKDSMFLYIKTKGQTEEALAETGFEKVSIFNPAFLETVEPRTRFRAMERISFTIFQPINRMFNLHQIISVATVGKAMHRVAEDATLKPKDPKNTKTSVIGSLVAAFANSDIEAIGKQN